MKTLKQEQFLPVKLDEAWEFFSSPGNLNKVTPNDMNFEIRSEVPTVIYEGLFIIYRIKPLFNLSIEWCTEITHVKDKMYFVDEQRIGPYRIWHHEHHFKQVDGGVIMTDLLNYEIGKSVFGWLAGKIVVDRKVTSIFNYRKKYLNNILRNKDLLIN